MSPGANFGRSADATTALQQGTATGCTLRVVRAICSANRDTIPRVDARIANAAGVDVAGAFVASSEAGACAVLRSINPGCCYKLAGCCYKLAGCGEPLVRRGKLFLHAPFFLAFDTERLAVAASHRGLHQQRGAEAT